MVTLRTKKEEAEEITAIAKRALFVFRGQPTWKGMTILDLEVDLIACHLNGCPLDLTRLLHADQKTFVHDLCGIVNNINRRTGALDNCFVPRTAQEG